MKLHLELLAQFKVERAQRFVQQQDLRFVDDGAGQGDALLLAAGKLRGFASGEVVDFDRFHHSLHAPGDFRDRRLSHAQAKSDVVEDAEVRE